MDRMTGMDIAQVFQLSNAIEGRSREVQRLIERLTAAIEGADWKGADRERFLNEWRSVHASALRNMASAMHDASRAAFQSARAQEEASGR